jgi:four helix bundle protein
MFPYESLEVYKKAFQFHGWVHKFLNKSLGIRSYIKNQLGRAALSIPLNIAEGSAKLSPKDRKNVLSIARGSVFECNALIRSFSEGGQQTKKATLRVAFSFWGGSGGIYSTMTIFRYFTSEPDTSFTMYTLEPYAAPLNSKRCTSSASGSPWYNVATLAPFRSYTSSNTLAS